MRYPSLIFRAELPWPGDARHPKDYRRQAVNTREIVDILIRRSLGATVRRVEVQGLALGDSKMVRIRIAALAGGRRAQAQVAVNLVGGCEKKERAVPAAASSIQNVEGAPQINLKVRDWIDNRGGHRHLSCK